MKHTQHSDKEAIDKLNAFYIYKNAGTERLREILPQQTHFCEANSNKSYNELRNELLKQSNGNASR
jgi:hypothetical protein